MTPKSKLPARRDTPENKRLHRALTQAAETGQDPYLAGVGSNMDLPFFTPNTMGTLTDEEQFRVTGTLTPDRIEPLLDLKQRLGDEAQSSVIIHMQEAMAQFPDEDFLETIMGQLTVLTSHLRGSNKDLAVTILEALRVEQETIACATEYAIDEMHKAVTVLRGTEPLALNSRHKRKIANDVPKAPQKVQVAPKKQGMTPESNDILNQELTVLLKDIKFNQKSSRPTWWPDLPKILR